MAAAVIEATPYRPWSRWNRVRQHVFEVKGRTCVVQTNCRGARATEIDHLVPWRDGGAWFDIENLRPSCKACNISRASNQKHLQGWRRCAATIVLCERDGIDLAAGDLVVDLVALEVALAAPGEPGDRHRTAAAVAWSKLLGELARGELVESGTVWLVSDDASLPHHQDIRKVAPVEHQSQEGSHQIEAGRW